MVYGHGCETWIITEKDKVMFNMWLEEPSGQGVGANNWAKGLENQK
jgi:hypothetical protein